MEIILILFIAAASIQIVFYLFVFSRLAFHSGKKNVFVTAGEPVSVIICAKNEATNLKKNLPLILSQQYPQFEVIVVNDNSADESTDLLNAMVRSHSNLKVVEIKQEAKGMSGKKLALTLGIKAAQYNLVLLTDADCRPASQEWIALMQRNFTPAAEIVLGYGPGEKHPDFWRRFFRFEMFYTGLQYLSFAKAGMPYMGVGRNLAYKKELFFEKKGFVTHKTLQSGDDDLFVNQAAEPANTRIELDSRSFTYTETKESVNDWLNQKRRHVSTGKFYRTKHKFILGLLSISHILFYLLLIAALILSDNYSVIAIVFGARFLIQGVIFYKSMVRLNERDLFLFYPIFDFLYFTFYSILAPFVIRHRKYKWK